MAPPVPPVPAVPTTTTVSTAVKKRALPKPKRVTFLLEASRRAGSRYGSDLYSQVLWMRLDGLTVTQIAAALNCGDDLITELLNCWQAQVEARECADWTPVKRNPRRWKKTRITKAVAAAPPPTAYVQHPTPKIA